jgi:hypothetical protein
MYGIFIEQAVWNKNTITLNEQHPGIMITKMPVIHFLPYEVEHKSTVIPEQSFDSKLQPKSTREARNKRLSILKSASLPDTSII